MNLTRRFLLCSLVCVSTFAAERPELGKGPDSLHPSRALRGLWKGGNGVMTCTQDDALYKKDKDHGPILFYDVPLQDGRVRFSFKAEGAKTLVFTANGADGHVFRFVMSERGTSIRAFPTEGAGPKSIALG